MLVIGSNSFSGSSAIARFIEEDYDVLGVSRSEEAPDVFLPYKWRPQTTVNFKFAALDINANMCRLKSLLEEFRPNVIINFAAQGMVAESWLSPLDWFQTNVMAQIELVEFLKTRPYLERFIQFTTPEVYGSTTGWISENAPFKPSTPYATSRAAFDFHLKNLHDAFGFPVIFTRAANVYGPGQQIYRIIPRAMISCLAGESFSLHGGGLSERAFIHMEDVADALCKIVERGVVGETYHISTTQTHKIIEIVEIIGDYYGTKIDEFVNIVDDRLGKDHAYKLSSRKINEQLGWSAQIDLLDGLASVDEWLKNNISFLMGVDRVYRHKK